MLDRTYLSAIENMATPSETMLKAKEKIADYLKCRADGTIGGHYGGDDE
jgi:hypothetical protein